MPASNKNPIRYKRELHFPSFESVLFLDPDSTRYLQMPSYRPSRVFRYHPYAEFRQRYITVDKDMRPLSAEYFADEDFRVIFGPYILQPVSDESLAQPDPTAAPEAPGRIRRWATWLLDHLVPNFA